MRPLTASEAWSRLDTKKGQVLEMAERCAALTIPNVMLPCGQQPEDYANNGLRFGAKCVNSIVNKMMISMFSPTKPAMRVDMASKDKKELLGKLGITEADLVAIFAEGEQEGMKVLDSLGVRPKLYWALRLLVVTGNILMDLRGDKPRIHSLRTFRVKRSRNQEIHTLVTKERIHFDELTEEVQAAAARQKTDGEVDYYEWTRPIPGGRYETSVWVNDTKLPDQFVTIVKKEDLNLHAIPWNITEEADYGSGMIEENITDFEAYSDLSRSFVDGAVAGCEVRGLVNPTGVTRVDDLKNSQNGDWVPGTPNDIQGFSFDNAQNLQQAVAIAERIEKQLGAAFLLQSAIIRDAERVTAEEIRLQAQELETSLGGTYSALAVWLQLPLCDWLLAKAGFNVKGTKVKVTVITGLDALSRRGDLDRFSLALDMLTKIGTLPASIQQRLKDGEIITFVGNSLGIDLSKMFRNDKEQGQYMADRSNAMAADAGNQAAAVTQAQQGAMNA